MYIKIPKVGNLELTENNFSEVYFRCPICGKETSRNAEELFLLHDEIRLQSE